MSLNCYIFRDFHKITLTSDTNAMEMCDITEVGDDENNIVNKTTENFLLSNDHEKGLGNGDSNHSSVSDLSSNEINISLGKVQKLPKAKKSVGTKRASVEKMSQDEQPANNTVNEKSEKPPIFSINLSDIESVLGLGNKTLHQLDAKSLDKMLLERLQKQHLNSAKVILKAFDV